MREEVLMAKNIEQLISSVLSPGGPIINAKRFTTCSSMEEFFPIIPSTMMVKSCDRVIIEDYERYYLVLKDGRHFKLDERIICYVCKGNDEGKTLVYENASSIKEQTKVILEDVKFIIHDSYRDAPLDDCDYPSVRIVTIYQIK